MTTKFSKYFTLDELTRSATATALKLNNQPNKEHLANLKSLTKQILDPLRVAIGHPIRVNSGYRGPALNRAVGGVSTSAHCYGFAADIVCPAYGDAKAFAKYVADFLIKNNIKFDQVIYEEIGGAKWCHVGLKHRDGRQRKQILTINRRGTFVGII